ncbi:MAG TPA: extracellular solute-binding protein [Patescibacteria group bacterium]
MNKKFLATLIILGILVVGLIIFLVIAGGKPETPAQFRPVTLDFWGVFDEPGYFEEIIAAYQVIHPNVNIRYRRLRFEEYERELLEAFAQDRGPDIFAIHNTWIGEYQTLTTPAPAVLTLTFPRIVGTLKKETVVDLRAIPSITLRQLRTNYVDVVYDDVVVNDQIYGLPLSVDNLALFYNRDLLNNAGIPQPPRSWNAFQEQVIKITKVDSRGNILLSGGAIGASRNIERSTDILSVLMMQNGANMVTNDVVTFHRIPPDQPERPRPPGEEALIFYTDFANPSKESYTWNADQPNSVDAFIAGQTAFFFGYAYHIPTIDARAPKLNYSIAKLPQIEGNRELNYANYWVNVVSRKTADLNEAWDFVQFMSSAEQVSKYLARAKKPTALRGLINSQLEDLDLSIFASQVLTATSWYRGKDAQAAETILMDMIDTVLAGGLEVNRAINLAAGQINQTLR